MIHPGPASTRDWLLRRFFPVTVVRDDPAALSFHLMAESEARDPVAALEDAAGVTPQRAYATVAVKQRLPHPCPLSAAAERGYVVDAAHVLADRPFSLSAGKIHHAAYDADIVGVDPEYRVHVRQDVLEEQDGPMLQHGLQAMQVVRIGLPRSAAQRPRREYLEERFERFRAA